MKHPTSIRILLFMFTAYWSFAQEQDNRIDGYELTLNGQRFFEMSIEDAIQAFGQPLSIEDYYYETEDLYAKKVEYEGARLFFVDNRGDGFTITGPDIAVTKHNIRVGEPISSLKNTFPESYKRIERLVMSIDLKNRSSFILIFYDLFGDIYEIRLQSY